jgi:hypothetical protein
LHAADLEQEKKEKHDIHSVKHILQMMVRASDLKQEKKLLFYNYKNVW